MRLRGGAAGFGGLVVQDPVVLTGVSGFIAKHIALAALNRGLVVRGTLRSPGRADEVRAALRPHLADPAALDRLSFATADLEQDAGWGDAMAGAAALIHCASPFPIVQPKNPDTLIRPALQGTRRVLTAAADAGVRRVVLTSSTVAVLDDARDRTHTEDDWCDPDGPTATPYARSKTLAERAAWDIAAARGLALTTINPGMVLGPPLDRHFGSSLGLVQRILTGRDPLMPPFGLPVVDVRDVAEMHLRALERPQTAGRRYLAAAGSMRLAEIGQVIRAAWPGRRVPTREAPALLMRLVALFDPQVRSILPKLGRLETVSNARAVAELGIGFIPAPQAVVAAAGWLIAQDGRRGG